MYLSFYETSTKIGKTVDKALVKSSYEIMKGWPSLLYPTFFAFDISQSQRCFKVASQIFLFCGSMMSLQYVVMFTVKLEQLHYNESNKNVV